MRAQCYNIKTFLTFRPASPTRNIVDLETLHREEDHVARIISALKQCSRTGELELGKAIHKTSRELKAPTSNTFLANTLLSMYCKCGSLTLAREIFDAMSEKDTVTWTCLILGYVENGHSSGALELYNSMSCKADSVTYIAVLKACIGLASEKPPEKEQCMEKGMDVHKDLKRHGLDSHLYVGSTLVKMYVKLGNMKLAKETFDGMPSKSAVTWTSLILGYVEHGECLKALDTFDGMDCEADHVTYMAALKSCASLARQEPWQRKKALDSGVAIHQKLRDLGLDRDTIAGSSLVDMYSKCGNMNLARKAFEKMSRKDAISWACLVLGYVENGESWAALELFSRMDCEPSPVTYIAVITALTELASVNELDKDIILERGASIHEQVRERCYGSNATLAGSLVKMYIKSGNMRLAREVFEGMRSKELSLWTCMMFGYVETGDYSLALQLFHAMDCTPDSVTYVAALRACTGLAKERDGDRKSILEKGIAIHSQAQDSLRIGASVPLGNSLIEMYSRCGNMKLAREVFESMESKEVVAWTCLILGYVENGQSSIALDMFDKMECEPDHVTYVAVLKACASLAKEEPERKKAALRRAMEIHGQVKEVGGVLGNSLVDMYSKFGEMTLARETFEGMTSRNVVTWTSLILGYVESGKYSLALEMFTRMDCEPNHVTYVAALKACGGLVALSFGREIHARICKLTLEEDVVISNTLVDFYGRSGCMASALQVFNSMTSPDIVSWNALIAGYNSLGDSSQVFASVRSIQECGLEMNAITVLCILTACSQAGLVELGQRYLESCVDKLGISPTAEHYNCLVNMLAKANKLQEATSVAKSAPLITSNKTMDDFAWCLKKISFEMK